MFEPATNKIIRSGTRMVLLLLFFRFEQVTAAKLCQQQCQSITMTSFFRVVNGMRRLVLTTGLISSLTTMTSESALNVRGLRTGRRRLRAGSGVVIK